MSTVVPMKMDQASKQKKGDSSLVFKILTAVFFVSTVALAIVLGIVASDDSTDTVTKTTTVQNDVTTLVRVDKELTFGMAMAPTITNALAYLKDFAKHPHDSLINFKKPISFFDLAPPYGNVVPMLASESIDADDCVFSNDGSTCDFTVDLRTTLTWSDGEVIDADDVVYTKTLADLLSIDFPVITKVNTSRVIVHIDTSTANEKPGYCAWFGAFTKRSILPYHYWSQKVNEVSDPSELLTIDDSDMPHFAPYDFFYFERYGDYITSATGHAVPQPEDTVIACRDGQSRDGTRMPYNVGTQTEDCVTYTTGPYFDYLTLNAYGSGDALVQSVAQDESRENWLMQYRFKYNDTVLETYNASADFLVTESEGAGTRYMGFNMNEFPGSSKAFRKSVSCLFDKETFLASDAAFSNAVSENQFVAHSEWRTNVTNGALFDCMGMTQDERRAYATGKLQEEGWSVDGSWTDFPLVNLTGPNNESLPLNDSAWKILAPLRNYDELRAGAAEQIAQDLTDFGIPINASLVDFGTIEGTVFNPKAACPAFGATSVNYFMYILGWGYSAVAVQTHLPAFFKSSEDICVKIPSPTAGIGYNVVHFSNSTFDDLDVQFKAANTLEDTIVFAKDQQEILQEELPYMNLFNLRHTDVFRDVVLPFELNDVMLDGYSSFGGIPELLKPVDDSSGADGIMVTEEPCDVDDSSGADGIMVTEEPCPAVMMMAGTPFPTQADPNSGCIYLGLINDYTGPYAAVSSALETAQRLFWAHSNADARLRGLSGQYSVAIRQGEDSGYDPTNHAIAYDALRNNSFALAMSIGTPQTMGILDKMNDDNMVASPMSWWSGWADTAVDQNLILEFGSSYCAGAMNAYTYFNSTYSSLTKYGFVGFAGDYGGDGHTGLAHMLDKDGLASPWTYLPSTWEFNVTTAIEGIVANQLEVVMLATGPTQTAEIVSGVAQAGLSPKWIALAPAYNDAFVAPDFPLKALMESSMYVTTLGAPYSYDSIGHAKMRAALTASGVNSTNSFLLTGWMSQYSLESALRALVSSGDAMTRANLRQKVTSLQVSSDNMLMPYQLNSPSSSSVIGKADGSAADGVQLLEFVSTDESVADVCFG